MGMRKIRKPTSSTKNAPARQLRSSVTAFVSSNPLEESPNPLKISREQSNRLRNPEKREYPAGDEYSPELRKDLPSALVRIPASQDSVDVWQTRGKKRRRDSEERHPYKRYRGSLPKSQLSEDNLKKLGRDLENLEGRPPDEMDPGSTVRSCAEESSIAAGKLFGSKSRHYIATLAKSSVSNSFYRYHILDEARIYVRPKPPPTAIQAEMDIIFGREVPEKRRKEISGIAKHISQQFINNLRGAHREDDLVELVYEALHMMHKDETFDFPRKAGIVLL